MPEAAWCSACGAYVWVASNGQCQNGHGPEYLSGRYVDMPSEATQVTPGPTAAPTLAAPTPETFAPVYGPPLLTDEMTHHLVRRSAAFLVDYAIALALTFTVSFAVAFLLAMVGIRNISSWSWMLGILILVGYNTLLPALMSTTPGKAAFGLRIIDIGSGGPISLGQAFKRSLWLGIDSLFWGVVGLARAQSNRWRRRLGDSHARTVVVLSKERVLTISPADAEEFVAPKKADIGLGAKPSRGFIIALAVMGTIIVLFIGAFVWLLSGPDVAPEDAATATSSTSATDLPPSAEDVAADNAEEPEPAPATTNVQHSAADLVKYIRAEYPDYRIVHKQADTGIWQTERHGTVFTLQHRRHAHFRLVVTLCALKAGESVDDAPAAFYEAENGIVTTDMIFSRLARSQQASLKGAAQDALVAAISAKRISDDMLVFDTWMDDEPDPDSEFAGIYFSAARGSGALKQAIASRADYGGSASRPSGPNHSVVAHVTIELE